MKRSVRQLNIRMWMREKKYGFICIYMVFRATGLEEKICIEKSSPPPGLSTPTLIIYRSGKGEESTDEKRESCPKSSS